MISALYTLAGKLVEIKPSITCLKTYKITKSQKPTFLTQSSPRIAPIGIDRDNPIKARGFIAGKNRQVQVSASTHYHLDIEEIASFTVSGCGSTISRTALDSNSTDKQWEEVLLGPPLMLALALQDNFALHGSALLSGATTLALVGCSGAGKSTLARELALSGFAQRIADDVLPASFNGERGLVHPHFPQLKLSPQSQYPIKQPAALPMAAIIEVLAASPVCCEVPELKRANAHQAIQILIRHTVAARLFPPALLSRHFAFCAHLSRTVPVFQLHYPHAHNTLPQVCSVIYENIMKRLP